MLCKSLSSVNEARSRVQGLPPAPQQAYGTEDPFGRCRGTSLQDPATCPAHSWLTLCESTAMRAPTSRNASQDTMRNACWGVRSGKPQAGPKAQPHESSAHHPPTTRTHTHNTITPCSTGQATVTGSYS